jgi:Cu+-exporting ATPase
MDKKVLLKVQGMDCTNCALTINRTLSKEGFKDVTVEFITGEVTFAPGQHQQESISKAVKSIRQLGYQVNDPGNTFEEHIHSVEPQKNKTEKRFLISLLFTIPLFFHMLLPIQLLHNPIVQLLLCLPVIYIGFIQFGKSAFYSVKAKVPNMDVLIFIGSTSAFLYSLAGLIIYNGSPEVQQYLFFETAATIITLVLLGNLIEQRSVKKTTSAITQLGLMQPAFAKKIILKNGQEEIISCEASSLQKGDWVLINSGDRIPADGIIISGKGSMNESMLTGESQPVYKTENDTITGGTILEDGNLRIRVTETGKNTVLARIIELVKSAQHSKPQIQKLGDRISAIFVPVVLGISFLTFLYYIFFTHVSVSKALMNSIAVLVISCPCAMGLATPTAVMVGLGRAARNGILIKGGSTIEELAKIKTFVFDKTGTLTTGNFKLKNVRCFDADEKTVLEILYSLEKNSSHPIARSLQVELAPYANTKYEWKSIREDKGIGINATDSTGDLYSAGSFQMVKHFYNDLDHGIYVLKNNKLIAVIDLDDEIKPGVIEVIKKLKQQGNRIVMLSGDRKKNCESVALKAGITEYYFEKLPGEKLIILEKLMLENPTAMVGDGINDAPALAKATIGISISDATDAAIQSSQVILLSANDITILLKALRISNMTFQTIKQNLFWAFFYNVVAIPIAAAGFLSPMVAALSMAFSDIFVIGNSLRLRSRKL